MSIHDASDDGGTGLVIDATASSDGELGAVILCAIAEEVGADPTSFPPIGDSIDPDLLNEFVAGDSDPTKALSFEYLGYDVLVYGDGVVQVQ